MNKKKIVGIVFTILIITSLTLAAFSVIPFWIFWIVALLSYLVVKFVMPKLK